jgi:hypothetical protein
LWRFHIYGKVNLLFFHHVRVTRFRQKYSGEPTTGWRQSREEHQKKKSRLTRERDLPLKVCGIDK